jgi:hypothetical protein
MRSSKNPPQQPSRGGQAAILSIYASIYARRRVASPIVDATANTPTAPVQKYRVQTASASEERSANVTIATVATTAAIFKARFP